VDPITLGELQALKNSKNRKACCLDGIEVKMLKYGGSLFELRFPHVINECWKKCDMPSAWHTAKVISLFKKKGERTNCENYREISLLNSAYKVYSRIINQQLKTITDILLEEEQAGFRKGRSCTDNNFVIKQLIEKTLTV
jgi:sorting nexin-29